MAMTIKNSMILSIFLIVALSLSGCGQKETPAESSYSGLPILENAFLIGTPENHPNPVRIQVKNDTLYVAYTSMARIDLFDRDLKPIGSIPLDDPEPVYPTDFVIADSAIFVCSHARQIIVVYDRNGNFRESYGKLPDNITRLRPFSLAYLGGVLYVGDAGQRGVLAISATDAPGITERGELILTIPMDSAYAIAFPSALLITVDGRMVIGDASTGEVKAFTCDGRYIYPFDSVRTEFRMAPQGFAIDDIIDPSLQDSSSFDPSGLRGIGRIHMVDAIAGQIHMFNPVGKYIASYPDKDFIEKPADIAIDTDNNRVYVAEPVTGRILVYRYGE
jgi:hypothetical protein